MTSAEFEASSLPKTIKVRPADVFRVVTINKRAESALLVFLSKCIGRTEFGRNVTFHKDAEKGDYYITGLNNQGYLKLTAQGKNNLVVRRRASVESWESVLG